MATPVESALDSSTPVFMEPTTSPAFTSSGVVTAEKKTDESWQVSSVPEPKQYFSLDVRL